MDVEPDTEHYDNEQLLKIISKLTLQLEEAKRLPTGMTTVRDSTI